LIKHNSTLVVSNSGPGIISELNSENFVKKEVRVIKKIFSHNIPNEEVKEDLEIDNIRHEIGKNVNHLGLLQDSPKTDDNLIIKLP
jgi:hypothetical protein